MNNYEKLLEESPDITIDDKADLPGDYEGLYVEVYSKEIILINKKVRTAKKKRCILAEELGHYHTSTGNIIDQSKIENRKQEKRARRWAVDKLIRVEQFIDAFNAGVQNRSELAEFLEVTEDFIEMAIDHFKGIYGYSHTIGEYTIVFSPLYIFKKFE